MRAHWSRCSQAIHFKLRWTIARTSFSQRLYIHQKKHCDKPVGPEKRIHPTIQSKRVVKFPVSLLAFAQIAQQGGKIEYETNRTRHSATSSSRWMLRYCFFPPVLDVQNSFTSSRVYNPNAIGTLLPLLYGGFPHTPRLRILASNYYVYIVGPYILLNNYQNIPTLVYYAIIRHTSRTKKKKMPFPIPLSSTWLPARSLLIRGIVSILGV